MTSKRWNLLTRIGVISLCVLAVSATCVSARPYVETLQRKKIYGTSIRAKADGTIILQTEGVGSRTFRKGQYLRAYADKPEAFDQAGKLASAGRYDDAIKLLNEIIVKYRYLGWDDMARAALPGAYAGKGDFEAAVRSYEDLFKASSEARKDEELQWQYMEALLRAERYSKLESTLADIVSSGNRAQAARAQIMRGDLKLAQGQVEAAALDYLRTIVLFQKEEGQQAEATFKAAEALSKLRDRRAKDLYREVVEKYPDSPYAQQARSRL